MKFQGLLFVMAVMLVGCGAATPSPASKEQEADAAEQQAEYERTISYQEIIEKINSINVQNKNNKRVKEFIKEYRYNVSDDDSKNSAREKALNQVKSGILEEVGVFVESYLQIDKITTDRKYKSSLKSEIKNLTAGIVKTEVISEKFDGKSYYVKARVLVDPDSVSEGISEVLKIRANQSEIKKLNKLLAAKEQEVDLRSKETIDLQKRLSAQELLNIAKENDLQKAQAALKQAQQKLARYEAEENRINTEFEKIMNRIETQTDKVMDNIERGMTKNEVLKLVGKPVNDNYDRSRYQGGDRWYYGVVSVLFEDNIVDCVVRNDMVRYKTLGCNSNEKAIIK